MRPRARPFSLPRFLRGWLALCVAGACATAAPVALAANSPPRTQIRANGDRAPLDAYTTTWSFRERGGSCSGYVGDGIPDFGPVIDVAHRHARPRIAMLRDRRPRVGFRSYTALGRDGYVKGRGRRVRHSLDRVRRAGNVEWRISFRVDVTERPYFTLGLSYPERGRCRTGGSANYAFSIGRE